MEKPSTQNNSSRTRLRKLSAYPSSQGLPGSIYRVCTPNLPSHVRLASAMNAGPLSLRMSSGVPYITNRSVSRFRISSDRTRPEMSRVIHLRVYSSKIVKHFRVRLEVVLSKIESQIQRWLGRSVRGRWHAFLSLPRDRFSGGFSHI